MIVRASGGKWIAHIDTREYRDGLGYRLMRSGWIYEREPRAHYWTTDPLVASEWAEHADPATRQILEEQARRLNAAIEMSRATSAQIEADLPLKLTPYPYQVAGIAACEGRRAVLLADEPGLGKTLQALAVVALRRHYPCLIVCPASMRLTWRYEILRTISGVSESDISIVYGRSIADIAGTKYIIIGYDILPQRWQQLAALGIKAIILDESHYTKTLTSKRTMAARDLVKAVKPATLLLLTGTPVLNRPAELVSQLEIMGVMRSFAEKRIMFYLRYCDAKRRTIWVRTQHGPMRRLVWDWSGASNTDELARKLRATCMVRRIKQDVLKDLPPKRHQAIVLSSQDHRTLIDAEVRAAQAVESLRTKISELQQSGSPDAAAALEQVRGDYSAGFAQLARIRREIGLAKVPPVVEVVNDLLSTHSKIVLWAHHHDVVDGLRVRLSHDHKVVTFTGRDSEAARQEAIEQFQRGDARVIIGSIHAAGVGITLAAASAAVFCELDWTPGVMDQAEDRIHRIGQRDSVMIYYCVLDGSLDHRMVATLLDKGYTVDAILS